ncbi:MAG: hypothetical protein SWK76_03745 [Actinomycetota bacterium]|nr:hypothetical protein [Actinomycetota bacterium]
MIFKEVKDERAAAAIAQLQGYYGLPPSRLSFLLFTIATATYLKYGPVHVRGKPQAPPRLLWNPSRTTEERSG